MNDTIGRSLPILGLLLLLNAVLPGFYHDLWNPDEPRLAHLARGMLSEGDWVVPRVNGEVFVEQPPLQAWLIALSMSAFGSGIGKDWVPRLPTMFFSLALLYLVYRVGLRYWGQGVGMIAAGLLMTTVEYYVSYQRAIVDTSLAFFVSLAMFQLVALGQHGRAVLQYRQAQPQLF